MFVRLDGPRIEDLTRFEDLTSDQRKQARAMFSGRHMTEYRYELGQGGRVLSRRQACRSQKALKHQD